MKVEGYQLLECLAVCLLLTLLVGVGGISLNRSLDRYRLECSAQGLAADLGSLRIAAVSRKTPLSVSIYDCRSKYAFGLRNGIPVSLRSLRPGVSFENYPKRPLTFYSRGNAVPAGSYLLSSAAGQCKVVVAPTGRIRCEYLN
jgi:hypothetical protein